MNMTPIASETQADGLFARARSGDESAWEELFHACYPKVVRVVRRKLNPPMRSLYDSTDFASDVWGSLVAKSDRFDFPTVEALMAFLAKAAQQKVVDEYRRLTALKRDARRETRIDEADGDSTPRGTLASPDPTPSQVFLGKETFDRLLDRLTTAEREAVELKRVGHSNEEIAARLDWNVRKVQRLFKTIGDSWLAPGGPRP